MTVMAVCFYTPDSWKQLKKTAVDKKGLDDMYEEWLSGFHKVMSSLRDQGFNTMAINVQIDELEKWCKQRKLKNTGENRSKYAAEMAEKLS